MEYRSQGKGGGKGSARGKGEGKPRASGGRIRDTSNRAESARLAETKRTEAQKPRFSIALTCM